MAGDVKTTAEWAAERSVASLGMGYDVSNDVRLAYCKGARRMIELEGEGVQKVRFPGGAILPAVPMSVRIDKGERVRFRTDVLSFQQMSEHFNQSLSLSGKIPCGLLNAMFGFCGCWKKDASSIKGLAFDGWFITLYNVELERLHLVLKDEIKQEVPSTWDPAALARFIQKNGTHIIVGVKMGGKDVVYMKQQQRSTIHRAQMQKMLKELADNRFADSDADSILNPGELLRKDDKSAIHGRHVTFSSSQTMLSHSKQDVVSICSRRGGIDTGQGHTKWLATVPLAPDAIGLSLLPITSLLNGVPGSGFLIHAMNLYLCYKPAIEELHNFLEYQLPRQWAPVYADHSLALQPKRKKYSKLQFSLIDPKLFVNTAPVDSKRKPATGIRLFLEGRKQNKLAVHLQHLCSIPTIFPTSDEVTYESDICNDHRYFEPVRWKLFGHVCTAPVEWDERLMDERAHTVTGARLHVQEINMKKVLFLRLTFFILAGACIRRSEWDGSSPSEPQKSGYFSASSTRLGFSQVSVAATVFDKVEMNSAVFGEGPPVPANPAKMLSFVSTAEVSRGPEDSPGYWVITGAQLCVEGGKITVRAKYSLLSMYDDESPL